MQSTAIADAWPIFLTQSCKLQVDAADCAEDDTISRSLSMFRHNNDQLWHNRQQGRLRLQGPGLHRPEQRCCLGQLRPQDLVQPRSPAQR